jgi:hypothetical protein
VAAAKAGIPSGLTTNGESVLFGGMAMVTTWKSLGDEKNRHG